MLVESKAKEKIEVQKESVETQETPRETRVTKKEETTDIAKDTTVTDIMKDTTSGIINQMRDQLPSNLQLYSDLYQEYLQMMDNLFGTYIISRKPIFDMLGSEEEFLKSFKEYSNAIAGLCQSQIEAATNFLHAYIPMRIEAVKIYDTQMQILIETYGNIISQSFSNLDKKQ